MWKMKKHTEDKKNGEPPAAPGDDAASVTIDKKEYDQLCRTAAENKDRYVRLFAEFDNARKRFEREKFEFVKYANQGLILEFLNILDDLQRSVNAAEARHQDYESFLKGVEMIMAHLYDLLKRNGLKAVESVGKKFDPHCHEVLMQEPSDRHEDGTILEEFQKGYYLDDRVIRTAKVKVAVRPSSGQSDGPEPPADAAAGESGQ